MCVLMTAADRNQMLSLANALSSLDPQGNAGTLGGTASLLAGLVYGTAANLRALARTGLDLTQYMKQHPYELAGLLFSGRLPDAVADQAQKFAIAAAQYGANGDVRKTVNAALYRQAVQQWNALQADFRNNPRFLMGQVAANVAPLPSCGASDMAAATQAARALQTESAAFRELGAITEEIATGVAQDEATLAQALPANATKVSPPASIGGVPAQLCMTKNACVPYSLGRSWNGYTSSVRRRPSKCRTC
jgi:hypothetical protein